MDTSITVILPVYNTKPYLKEAIDSIVEQKSFIKEIIIIDDGSTDGSGEFLDRFYGNIEYINIIHTENKGQGAARNLGIEKSKGNFIYCFDSDDILLPELFESFLKIYNDNPNIELFCFSGESFLDDNYPIEEVGNPNVLSEKAYKRKIEKNCKTGEEAFILLSKEKSFFPGPPLYIFKKSVLIENNISFSPIRYEDEEFTPKLFLHAGNTFITNKVYFKRRVRQGSTMQKQRSFDDIWGYLKTIETLTNLANLTNIKLEAKELLNKRIENFVRSIIIVKTVSKISLTKEQKKIYKSSLKPFLKKNKELMVFHYKYPVEYNLRKLKSKLF